MLCYILCTLTSKSIPNHMEQTANLIFLVCRSCSVIPVTSPSLVAAHYTKRQHQVTQCISEGQTAVVVAVEGRVIGLLFAADTVRSAAPAAVGFLAKRGITVRVASGDRKEAVWAAAAAAGLRKEDSTWGVTPGMATAFIWYRGGHRLFYRTRPPLLVSKTQRASKD